MPADTAPVKLRAFCRHLRKVSSCCPRLQQQLRCCRLKLSTLAQLLGLPPIHVSCQPRAWWGIQCLARVQVHHFMHNTSNMEW